MKCQLLKSERVKLGLTQEEVAQKLGLTATSYSKKENGHIDFSLSQLKILKDLFKLSLNDFENIFLN